MEKYNILNLYVITVNDQKFICEKTDDEKIYKEILTERVIALKDEYQVEELRDYFAENELLTVSKYSILDKYIDINKREKDDYYDEESDLSFLISQTMSDPSSFYKDIGEALTPDERDYIKALIRKSCNTCSNGSCRVEQVDKPVYDCPAWINNRIVGEYKVLKLNRKTKNNTKSN